MVDSRRAHSVVGIITLTLIAALAGCGGGSAPKATASTTPGAPATTVAPTQTPSPPGVWATLSGCGSYVPDTLRVQYQGTPNSYAIQRSDDCGATWRDLENPQIPGVPAPGSITYWSVAATPAYPDTVYITAQVTGDAQVCSTKICQVQYVSTDGGQTWARLILPTPGYLSALSPEEPLVSAIGNRLYGIVTDALITAGPGGGKQSPAPEKSRLVVSTDHGVHWSLCDGPIAAQGLQVAQYAAPPTGNDLYVIAMPQNATSTNPPLSVWVSHDVGATWSASGPTPGTGTAATREGVAGGAVSAVFAGNDIASGRSTVYLDVVNQGVERAMASADGGHTWQSDNSLIFHVDAMGYSPTMIGTLPDSSLLVEYPNGDGATIAWKPGAAPRTVAQNPSFRDFFNPLVVATGTGVYLWLSGDSGGAATPGVKYTQLQL